ncbi:hypothetical protein [Rhodococcus sp. NKCM2511]|uniref:hypothetical protein n=1 Tax=Rhodococcus sp. NKCM2511 TaxID=2766011 RepID=UPI001910338D|nr:hypothetical protein [Rhodococcus sp. NKCM2511]
MSVGAKPNILSHLAVQPLSDASDSFMRMSERVAIETQSTPVDGHKCPKCRYPVDAQTLVVVYSDRTMEDQGVIGLCLRDSCGWEGKLS